MISSVVDMEISAYYGVGPIRLGMTQDEVRKLMSCEFKSFMKTPDSVLPTDDFVGKGIHVYYRAPGLCEAVEMFPPANPTLHGSHLLGLTFQQALKLLGRHDSTFEVDDCGMTSNLLGIGLYVPDLSDSEDAPVKAVIVFEKGYYN